MNPLFDPARADRLEGYVARYSAQARAIRLPRHSAAVERWRPLVEEYWRLIVGPMLRQGSTVRWLDVEGGLRMVFHESRGVPDAVNRVSGAAGLFQHIPAYLPWRLRQAAPFCVGVDAGWLELVAAGRATEVSPLDPEASAAGAAWLRAVQGWGPWSPFNSGVWQPYTLTTFWDQDAYRYAEVAS